MLFKIVVLKNFANLTGKAPVLEPLFNKVLGEICEIFKNTFPYKTPLMPASDTRLNYAGLFFTIIFWKILYNCKFLGYYLIENLHHKWPRFLCVKNSFIWSNSRRFPLSRIQTKRRDKPILNIFMFRFLTLNLQRNKIHNRAIV